MRLVAAQQRPARARSGGLGCRQSLSLRSLERFCTKCGPHFCDCCKSASMMVNEKRCQRAQTTPEGTRHHRSSSTITTACGNPPELASACKGLLATTAKGLKEV